MLRIPQAIPSVLLAAAACAMPPAPGPPAPLVVISDLDNAPFAAVDETGRPAGRDVEMMDLIAGVLGRPLEWRRIPFAELLPAIEAGAADVACATLGITSERAERVEFSRPYFTTTIAVVVRTGPNEPRELADLAGRRIAAGLGTTSELAARERLPEAMLEDEEPSGAGTAQRLVSRAIDAVVLDGPAADAMVAASGGRLARLAEPLAEERYALVVAQGRTRLLAELDAALELLERTGRLRALDRSYELTE